jgi:phosphatidylglycerol:prolipoprotein diacylglycerol transferase
LFPYVQEPVLRAFGFSLTAFQILVFASVIAGYEIVVRRAARFGWDRDQALGIVLWTIFIGFVGSHVFDTLLYERDMLRARPIVLLEVWGTMSSFGGLIGGVLGALWAMRRQKLSPARMFAFLDIVAFAFPFSWIFGRLGCSLAHDHIGVASQSVFAVRFPDGPRFDLGLLELLYTIFICALFLALDRKPRPTGFYVALFCALYGPVRFLLDTLRIGDERYWGWTPGQYASVACALLGVMMLGRLGRTVPAAAG